MPRYLLSFLFLIFSFYVMFCFVLTSLPLMLCIYLQTFEAALFLKKKKKSHFSFNGNFTMISTEIDCYCRSILVMWSECRFLDTEVDGSNPGISMLCPFEQDTLSALLQSTQL